MTALGSERRLEKPIHKVILRRQQVSCVRFSAFSGQNPKNPKNPQNPNNL